MNTNETAIELLKDLSVISVAEKFQINLKKSGNSFVTLCPFHDEKTPSFTLTEGKGFKCFGCGVSGGSIKLYQKLSGIENFREAVIAMASDFGVHLEYTENHFETNFKNYKNPENSQNLEVKTMNSQNFNHKYDFDNFEIGKLSDAEKLKPKTRAVGDLTEVRTTYQYSDFQWVERIERFDKAENRIKFPLGKRSESYKHIIPHYINDDGEIVNAKGEKNWPFYRQDEAIKFAKGKWALMPEGEKCVETLRELGFVAISRMGADKTDAAVQRNFSVLKVSGIAGVVLIADNDDVGEQECEKFQNLALEVGLPCFWIKTSDFWDKALKNGDVSDWITLYSNLGQQRLSEGIEVAVGKKMMKLRENSPAYKEKKHLEIATEKIEQIFMSEIFSEAEKEIQLEKVREKYGIKKDIWKRLINSKKKDTNKMRLLLDLKAVLQSESKFDQNYELAMLAQNYRISVSMLKEMLNSVKGDTGTAEFEVMSLSELFAEGSDAIEYLVPGLIPKGETVLIASMPKVGKSILAVELAYCVVTGEAKFLGEKCQTGKVLYVSVDESKNSVKRKMIKRGFREFDDDKIQMITKFTIDQLPKLEKQIEDFRPSLVIVDSLKRITKGHEISENSAEFSDVVYSLSELCTKYSASCLLIHHLKKEGETVGVENVRGSTAITGASNNVWVFTRIASPDPNNKKKSIYRPNDLRRKLFCYSRDDDGKELDLELNLENNSWSVTCENGMDAQEKLEQQTAKERILNILRKNQKHHPDGVTGSFIFDCLDTAMPGKIAKNYMYTTLNGLVNNKLISSKPAPGNKRYVLYSLPLTVSPNHTHHPATEEYGGLDEKINNVVIENEKNSIPSPPSSGVVENIYEAESTSMYDLENTYTPIHDTYIEHTPENHHFEPNNYQNPDDVWDSDTYIDDRGDTGGVGDISEKQIKKPVSKNLIENELVQMFEGEVISNQSSGNGFGKKETENKKRKEIKHSAPQVGVIYVDKEGKAFRVTHKTDNKWFDHKGRVVTPGICRDCPVFTAADGQRLINNIQQALKDNEAGNSEPLEILFSNPGTYSQIEASLEKLENHFDSNAIILLQNYLSDYQLNSEE